MWIYWGLDLRLSRNGGWKFGIKDWIMVNEWGNSRSGCGFYRWWSWKWRLGGWSGEKCRWNGGLSEIIVEMARCKCYTRYCELLRGLILPIYPHPLAYYSMIWYQLLIVDCLTVQKMHVNDNLRVFCIFYTIGIFFRLKC